MKFVLLGSLFTTVLTALGAAVVFCFKTINSRILDIILGVSGGIMVAAAFWSLLLPAQELSLALWNNQWLVPCLGFFMGGIFIAVTALVLNHIAQTTANKKRNILLISAMTLHNIPEGLAVGVGFSGFVLGTTGCTLSSAILITLGIGLQNIPDGLAVAVPLYRDGVSKPKAFFIAQATGIVEPIFAIIGYLTTVAIRSILPFCLAFAAGAMLTVVTNELLPDIAPENRTPATFGFIFGFVVMAILDIIISL